MPKVMIPLAEGFEELEAVTIIDILRRADVDVVVAGLQSGPVRASRGTVVIPDTELEAVLKLEFDMVILPGGMPGADNLHHDGRLKEMLERQHQEGRMAAAICAAPFVLASYGLLQGKRATSYPGFLDSYQENLEKVDAPVVVDGNVVTSRGPGTAMDFALTLVDLLCGPEKRQVVEKALVRPEQV